MAHIQNDIAADLIERVIAVNRNSKVVKGGRRFSFSALVAVGDGTGSVGLGFGKANEVTDAISKAMTDARRNIKSVARYNTTIPYAVTAKYKGAKVLLKPATEGTGVIAGGAVRAIVESAGYNDVLTKNLGSNNPVNVAKATVKALDLLISREDNLKRRGLPVFENGKNTAETIEDTTESESSVSSAPSEETPTPHEEQMAEVTTTTEPEVTTTTEPEVTNDTIAEESSAEQENIQTERHTNDDTADRSEEENK